MPVYLQQVPAPVSLPTPTALPHRPLTDLDRLQVGVEVEGVVAALPADPRDGAAAEGGGQIADRKGRRRWSWPGQGQAWFERPKGGWTH